MIAPRAVCSRRPRPSSAIRSASGSTAVSTASSSTMLAGAAGCSGHALDDRPNRAPRAPSARGRGRRGSPAARAGARAARRARARRRRRCERPWWIPYERRPRRGGVAADRRDRQLAVAGRLALGRAGLEQVDDHERGPALHLAEERERVVDVLDHVEGVGGVEAVRDLALEVPDRAPRARGGRGASAGRRSLGLSKSANSTL